MFIPTTIQEVKKRGWNSLDIILISGDTYTDNSYNGTALIGHWLIDHGLRVGLIAQPDVSSDKDITRLGQPELFWSVSAGCVDSMVANYTPTRKFRKDDDFTPGGQNNKRPDRATIAYTNLIKKYIKGKPIFLAGIEASLRRIVHYDYWSDSLRRSILFDSKADGIIYGMTELATLEVAGCISAGKDWHDVRGVAYIGNSVPDDYVILPSFEDCISNKDNFRRAFLTFKENNDPISGKGLAQLHGNRWLIQNRPQRNLTTKELDALYESDFENEVHPHYLKDGPVKAMETIKNSITTHRGCYGGCSFCAIAVHQGRHIISRSIESIISEIKRMASKQVHDIIIQDVGGPTANMYAIDCLIKKNRGACKNRSCLGKNPCDCLLIDHGPQIELLDKISQIPGVKKVFVNSGIRYDMILADKRNGDKYLENIIGNHVSGQMKVAPEHICDNVLKLMGKPSRYELLEFRNKFMEITARIGKEQYLTYYFIAAHPGCTRENMQELSDFCRNYLKINPEQVQVFTPTPSTESTMMFYTQTDSKGNRIYCERNVQGMQHQKQLVVVSNFEKVHKGDSHKCKAGCIKKQDRKNQSKRV